MTCVVDSARRVTHRGVIKCQTATGITTIEYQGNIPFKFSGKFRRMLRPVSPTLLFCTGGNG